MAVLPVLVFATFALRNVNYTLFSLALTPTVLLMLDIAHPITVTDSFLRVLHTIIGSVLALLSGYLLFPFWESQPSADSYCRSASSRSSLPARTSRCNARKEGATDLRISSETQR